MSLRSVGCRVMVHYTAKQPEEGDSAEVIRAHQTDYVVEPLSEIEEKKLADAPPKFWARLVDWPKKQR